MFVVPPTGRYVREERCQALTTDLIVHSIRPPNELAIAAAILESSGWECAIADAPAENLDAEDAVARVSGWGPDLVVALATVPTLAADMAFLEDLRARLPRARFVARGASFGLDPRGALARHPVLDVVTFKEADGAFSSFARSGTWRGVPGAAWREGERVVDAAPVAVELDDIPWPARHLLRNELYVRPDTGAAQALIEVARGCPFGCSYCLAAQVGGKRVRRRSPGSIVAEVEHCRARFGIRDFVFGADTFTLDRAWVIDLCRRLCEARERVRWVCNSRVDTIDDERAAWMRRAGCWGVSLGIESGDDETLDRIGKGATVAQATEAVRTLRRHGILSLGYLMIGFPWEDEESLRRSFETFLRIDPDLVEVHYVYPFPGTRIRKDMIAAGVIGPEATPSGAYARPAAPTGTIGIDRLVALRAEFVRSYHLRPSFAWRMAKRMAADPRVALGLARMALRVARDWVRPGGRG
jgi:radical SAM superfamily enzyme YgiQ (UPF0313 family)